MIRYRIFLLLLLATNFLLASTDDVTKIIENKVGKPPDKLILQKSKPYPEEDNLISKISKWIKKPFGSDSSEEKKNEDDLTASAAEYIGASYLAHRRLGPSPRNCYECNSEPWMPILGRSLHFPASSHSNSLEDNSHHSNKPYFREKEHVNKHYSLYHPPSDQYGAPQATFDFPRAGEVADFMLPPPYQSGNIFGNIGSLYGISAATYGPPKPIYELPQSVYGAPQAQYGSPVPAYRPPKPLYNAPPLQQNLLSSLPKIPKAPSLNYGPPSVDISPPPAINYGPRPSLPSSSYGLPSNIYGPPSIPINTYRPLPRKNIPKTVLRPVSQDFQPPLPGPGIQNLPLENTNPPPPIPSDSYGKPIAPGDLPLSETQFPSVVPSDSYGAPVTGDQQHYVEPISLGSGDSDEYSGDIIFNPENHFKDFESQHNEEVKANLYQKGLTDVQVVPSLRIADYTASIEHPINIIQSPILDLNVRDQDDHQETSNDYGQEVQSKDSNTYNEVDASYKDIDLSHNSNKLSENPIVVDDTYTSASNINTTYSTRENNTTTKRHNEQFLSSEPFKYVEDKLKEADLTTNLIQKLILEHNIIKDPQTQIVGIQKSVIDPKKIETKLEVIQPTLDYGSWSPTNQNSISTVIVPPRPPSTTWLSSINESYVPPKSSKKLQIIVPYLKAPENNNLVWNQSSQKPTAIYNKEYTTLTPVFVPPPISTESSNLWTKFVEDIRTVESHRGHSQGFTPSTTTQVYNIKEFLAKQQNGRPNNLLYNGQSLQKNIDDWTHQSYANKLNFGDKLTTKLLQVKNIPKEYFTTTPNYNDHPASSDLNIRGSIDNIPSSSNNKEYISEEIEDNYISPEEAASRKLSTEKIIETTSAPSVTYIVKKPQPSWDHNKVTLSNSTHEKVYMVTPQSYNHLVTSTPATAFSMAPKIKNGKINNVATMTRISVRVEAPSEKSAGKELKPVKVVYSEWPHLINNLATTTTHKPTTRHPLFGLMDLSAYTPPPNSTVETIGGHSKVTSVITPSISIYSSTPPAPSTNSQEAVKISPVASL